MVPKCLLCTRHCAYLPDFSSDLVRWWYSLHFTGDEVGSESCSQSGHNSVCHSHWINMMWPMRQHHGQPPCHVHWGCSFVPHFPVSELLYTTPPVLWFPSHLHLMMKQVRTGEALSLCPGPIVPALLWLIFPKPHLFSSMKPSRITPAWRASLCTPVTNFVFICYHPCKSLTLMSLLNLDRAKTS